MNSLILKTLPESERPWAQQQLKIWSDEEGFWLAWPLVVWLVLHLVLQWADHPFWLIGWMILYSFLHAFLATRAGEDGSTEWRQGLPLNRGVIYRLRLLRFLGPLLVLVAVSTLSLAVELPRRIWGLFFDGLVAAPWAPVEPWCFAWILPGLMLALLLYHRILLSGRSQDAMPVLYTLLYAGPVVGLVLLAEQLYGRSWALLGLLNGFCLLLGILLSWSWGRRVLSRDAEEGVP